MGLSKTLEKYKVALPTNGPPRMLHHGRHLLRARPFGPHETRCAESLVNVHMRLTTRAISMQVIEDEKHVGVLPSLISAMQGVLELVQRALAVRIPIVVLHCVGGLVTFVLLSTN